MENHQLIDPLSLKKYVVDSMVDCVMCRLQMPLSQLVAHQKKCELSRPKRKSRFIPTDHKRCIFCSNHPWVEKKYMERHMRRKHSNISRAIEVQPANETIETEMCKGVTIEMEAQVKSIVPSVQPPTLTVAKPDQVICSGTNPCPMPWLGSVKGCAILSIERDADGFDELVFTIM